MSAPQPQLTPSTFNTVRFSLLAGVLFFGGIAWFLSREDGLGMLEADTATLFRYAFYAFFSAAALGMLFIHRSLPQTETFQERVTRCILGYALAEGTALFGAVYLFLTGHALLYVIGLVLFLVAFMVFSPMEQT